MKWFAIWNTFAIKIRSKWLDFAEHRYILSLSIWLIINYLEWKYEITYFDIIPELWNVANSRVSRNKHCFDKVREVEQITSSTKGVQVMSQWDPSIALATPLKSQGADFWLWNILNSCYWISSWLPSLPNGKAPELLNRCVGGGIGKASNLSHCFHAMKRECRCCVQVKPGFNHPG